MIVTLTGASGVGKSSIMKGALERLGPSARILESCTTRAPRPSDLPSEYRYLDSREFQAVRAEGRFLWTVEVHGASYGTPKIAVLAALSEPQRLSFMILVPDVLRILDAFVRNVMGADADHHLTSFFVLSPGPAELHARLVRRGDGEAAIVRRLNDCFAWEAEARASGIPYIFIENSGPLANAVRRVRSVLS
ncbi:MAG: hypothetical protein A2128_01295 [Candidatus Liptonbacteria bacterium GWC1_60_9]|uniref:Guanylate kinase-like domain-containing protein n=3 Tax=Candidatus Liptoniibacteriota TaxID=1817909 RepID=A0A1G2CL15_9BACT|nr:MAG: hypothetical protein A2128_01295 [Candidatus Liptonbacteria bacterium GWC1_60_9]OGY98468.1 MAG: hypothetical protein A3E09_01880 [Candidatus Liptonbacteria bacterium RIFCSPHIGHO2_12_FULL_60_13]OGZ02039.1 MAG: hypothetical protein A3G64_02585 [Candidatus Liptonbacteria bacterium RIFCSPLOWO2_12_FULL_60_15]